jgi:NAD(P)-dependent dehydrogenase (short-subunit alcohol dehydrogenase family)
MIMSNDVGVERLWRYEGKTALVTGCSSGMGEATAALVAALGGRVVGLDRKPPSRPFDDFLEVDLADPTSIDAAVACIDEPVDALFNCAGISNGAKGASALDVFTINFIGTRHLTEALVPKISAGGAVATIASLGGLGWDLNLTAVMEILAVDGFAQGRAWAEAHPEQFDRGGYGFSKQCLIVYSKLRCVAWAARGIRTNTIGPSPVDTPMLADSRAAHGDRYIDAFPKPLGRVSTAAEQARVLAFLNSDAASYVTGQNLWTDGGYTAGVVTGQISGVVA